jgi:hypothetical protein
VPIIGDTDVESDETFALTIARGSDASIAKTRGVATIVNDDSLAWVTSTTAEFGNGTLGTGTYLADMAGGEITLKPTVGSEFAGTLLPTGWTSTALAAGGGSLVGNGAISVDGATVLAATSYSSGHTLEFVATFSGALNQNAGFGLTTALIPPFAMFGVKADGLFYARSVAPSQAMETPIPGSWFAAPHWFRIDWNPGLVVYWIDGVKVASHSITYSGKASTMRPAITDLAVDGIGLPVDWMRMSAYASSGVYTSPVVDAGAAGQWQNVVWTGDAPAGTTIVIEVRVGDTPAPDASWTAFQPIASGGSIGLTGRYAQYRATLTSTVPSTTPILKEVVLTYLD